MLGKNSRSLFISILVFVFSFTFYLYPDVPSGCKDCGGIENCLYGNGFDSGWTQCVVWTDREGRIQCMVSGSWCSN